MAKKRYKDGPAMPWVWVLSTLRSLSLGKPLFEICCWRLILLFSVSIVKNRENHLNQPIVLIAVSPSLEEDPYILLYQFAVVLEKFIQFDENLSEGRIGTLKNIHCYCAESFLWQNAKHWKLDPEDHLDGFNCQPTHLSEGIYNAWYKQ